MNKVLQYVYYNPKSVAYLGSIENVYKQAKRLRPQITKKFVDDWLHTQNTYTLHKPVRRKFPRNRVIAIGLHCDWQADLIDMARIKKFNRQICFCLTCIDVLSKRGFCVPIKSKKSEHMIEAFSTILKQAKDKPFRLNTDSGKEFLSKEFQAFLYNNDIQFFTSGDKIKCSIVERFNRSLKDIIWRYFTQNNTLSYLEMLPKILKILNTRYHRSIKCRPIDVTVKNEKQIFETLYGSRSKKPTKFRFETGDRVRIAIAKNIFDKGYVKNFTTETFTIHKQLPRDPPAYLL
jgi:hypothetical protein